MQSRRARWSTTRDSTSISTSTRRYFKFTCYTIMDSAGTRYHAIINGAEGTACSYWPDVQYMNLSKALRSGANDIDIEVTWTPTGVSGPVLAKLFVTGKDKDGKRAEISVRTDDTWQYSLGKWVPQTDPGRSYNKVEVVAPADTWAAAKNPLVLPKINTNTVVGVTDVRLKGGNAGSLEEFSQVSDYGDKSYFLKSIGYHSIEDYIFSQSCYQYPGQWSWGYDKQIAHNFDAAGLEFTVSPWAWVSTGFVPQAR